MLLIYRHCGEKNQLEMYLYSNTKWMVALATLSTGQKTALCTKAKTPTHHTHVLGKNKIMSNPIWLKQ